jgi:hypothetical protein
MNKSELLEELRFCEENLSRANQAYSMYPDKDNKQIVDFWKARISGVKAKIGGDCES